MSHSAEISSKSILYVALFLAVLIASLLFTNSSQSVRADEITLTNTSNELVNDDMVTNQGIDRNVGWLVVGTGEFNIGLFGVTFQKDTPGGFWLDVKHAAVCQRTADGGVGIDHPNNGLRPQTTFRFFNPVFTSVLDHQAEVVGEDCNNPDRRYWVPSSRIRQVSPGVYGGFILVTLTVDGCKTIGCSQQNSFRFRTDPSAGVELGYNSEVARLTGESFRNLPESEKQIIDFISGQPRSVWFDRGINSPYKFKINLAQTNLPNANDHTDYELRFDTTCSLQTISNGRVQFVDIDDGVLQSRPLAGYKTATFTLQRRLPGGSWQTVPSRNETTGGGFVNEVALRGGDGVDAVDTVLLGPIVPGYEYRGAVKNITRPNAVQFSLNDSLSLASSGSSCVAEPITCEVTSPLTVWRGQPFRVSALATNPNKTAIPVSSANYAINSPPPINQNVTINSTNNSIPANNGTRSYESASLSIATTGSYTLRWTLVTAAPNDTICTSTITVRPPPTVVPPNCGVSPNFTTSPLRTILVEIDLNTGSFDWPNGSVGGGLHIAVATQGSSPNWNSNWSVADPPPDANSAFTVLDNGGGETIQNVTRYDETTANVGYRYYVNDPEAAGNTRLRLEAPATTGDYTVVVRLYDKASNLWFPSSCQFDVEVELEPLTCDVITFSINPVEINKPFTSTVTVRNPNLVNVSLNRVRYATTPALFNGEISGSTVVPQAAGGSAGSRDFTTPTLTSTVSGDFDFNWFIDYVRKAGSPQVSFDCARGIDGSGVPPVLSFQQTPYVKLYGNDIFAGGGFGKQCNDFSVLSVPSAIAYMGVDDTNSFFQGTSAELAVFAINTIRGIRPGAAQPQDVSDIASLSRLAFANSGTAVPFDPASYTFGGGFGQTVCSEDWWDNKFGDESLALIPDSTEEFDMINLSSLDNDQVSYVITADRLTASNGTLMIYADAPIEDGTRLTIYVEGDVVLGRNGGTEAGITYASEEWSSTEEIPALFIIAQGNIYIDDRIERLDGVYVAQPDATDAATIAETGSIHTCYDSSLTSVSTDLLFAYENGSLPVRTAASSFLASNCNKKLTINGAFVARRVELLRSNGSVSLATENENPFDPGNNNVAEVFRFNPLLYVTGGDGVPVTGRRAEQAPVFESILSLPPSF